MATDRLNILITAKDKTKRAFGALKGSLAKIKSSVFSLKGALVGLGAAVVTRSIVKTTAEFEDLRDSLSSVAGGVEQGKDAFNFITDFAQRTQFDVQTLTRAFITLKATGIEPTEELLTTFTDTAAVTTDQLGTFEAMTRVLSRSTAGGLGLEELNQIADKGIPVWDIFTEKLGISRLEISALGQSAEGADKLTKVLIDGLNERFGGATQQKLDNLSTAMSNFGIAVDDAQDTFGQAGFSQALTEITNASSVWISQNKELFATLGELSGKGLVLFVKGIVKTIKAITDLTTGIYNLGKSLVDTFKEKIGIEVQPAINNFDASIVNVASSIEQFNKKTKKSVDNTKALRNATKSLSEMREDLMTKEEKAQKLFDDTYEKLQRNIAFQNLSEKEQADIVGRLTDQYAKAVEEVDELTEAEERARDIGKELGLTFTSAFEDAVVEGKKFRDILQGIYKDILRIILRKAITEPAGEAIGDFISGTLSGTLGGIFGSPKQFGGSVTGGRPHIVGESGPEVFVPSSSGSIVPNHQLGGGTNVVQNINVTTGVQQTVRAEIMNMLPMIKQASVDAVLEERGRGGKMAQAMGAITQST